MKQWSLDARRVENRDILHFYRCADVEGSVQLVGQSWNWS
jgi:hypothetical protein